MRGTVLGNNEDGADADEEKNEDGADCIATGDWTTPSNCELCCSESCGSETYWAFKVCGSSDEISIS